MSTPLLVKTNGVSQDCHRDEVCAEVVRLLIQERKRQGLSGNALAEKAGLSQSLISSLETNPWNPTLDTLLRIGDVLNVDVGEIISQARKKILQG
ncbi:MAG: helix-turn-helix transcriptional regulator [Verrucomicrobiia bacterium]